MIRPLLKNPWAALALVLPLLQLLPLTAHAQAAAEAAWLPTTAQVAAALQASPDIAQARARQAAQLQRARATEVGPGEWSVRLSQQQRRVRDTRERFAESSVGLERPVRLWGKAELDAQLAGQDRQLARIGLADALHEASRRLLAQWTDVLRAQLEWDSAQRELALAGELHRQVQVRLRLGDAAALDASLAQAELQRSQTSHQLAQARADRAAAQLQRLYPGLPQPTWELARQALPLALTEEATQALANFLERHHELRQLRAEAARAHQLAQRMERDRWPDPTVGLHANRERTGGEQILGLAVSVPLSGTYRQAQAQAAWSDALQLDERVRQRQVELSAGFEARWSQLQQQQQALVTARSAAATQRSAANTSQRAYQLGEHSLMEVIQNRRLANEQELASSRLLLDALELQAELTLDLHRLWDIDD